MNYFLVIDTQKKLCYGIFTTEIGATKFADNSNDIIIVLVSSEMLKSIWHIEDFTKNSTSTEDSGEFNFHQHWKDSDTDNYNTGIIRHFKD